VTGTQVEPDPARKGPPESDAEFKNGLLELIPFLRAFARSLCGNPEAADDLAQETLVKAWQARASFTAGTNLKAWLFTILRNQFYSDRRRAWRQAPWDQEAAERIPGTTGQQSWAADLSDTVRALSVLTDEQREALILVGAGGFSYEDAARICNCAVGTVKSRVARARRALISILEGEDPLPPADRPAEGDATNEIMAQLDRLASPQQAHRPQKPGSISTEKQGQAGQGKDKPEDDETGTD
jgi:RNA polymerase sigma-70 factor (ECF subfamily)